MSINSPAILGVQKRINWMQTEGINKCRNINERNLKEKAKTEKKNDETEHWFVKNEIDKPLQR